MTNKAAEKNQASPYLSVPFLFLLLFTPKVTLKLQSKQILQMLLEVNPQNIFPFQSQSQMRTPIQPKLHRNFRSQIRADAERRRGAP